MQPPADVPVDPPSPYGRNWLRQQIRVILLAGAGLGALLPILIVLALFGESAWIILLLVGLLYFAISSRPPLILRVAVPLFAAGLLTAHCLGYKIYGSATIYDNRPVLTAPDEVVGFALPNIVLTKSHGAIPLKGVRFRPDVVNQVSDREIADIIERHAPLLVELSPDSSSGLSCQYHINYWCGNTFDQTLLPRRLPSYGKADLGLILRSRYFVEEAAE